MFSKLGVRYLVVVDERGLYKGVIEKNRYLVRSLSRLTSPLFRARLNHFFGTHRSTCAGSRNVIIREEARPEKTKLLITIQKLSNKWSKNTELVSMIVIVDYTVTLPTSVNNTQRLPKGMSKLFTKPTNQLHDSLCLSLS